MPIYTVICKAIQWNKALLTNASIDEIHQLRQKLTTIDDQFFKLREDKIIGQYAATLTEPIQTQQHAIQSQSG